MKVIIQRVSEATVKVDGKIVGEIGEGLLVLLGVKKGDGEEDVSYLAEKTTNLRIMEDETGRMNLSVQERGGSVLVVSQFTLYAGTRKGRRPGFNEAAEPQEAERLYELFCRELAANSLNVAAGCFGAMMDVSLVNRGPVTIIIDSEQRAS